MVEGVEMLVELGGWGVLPQRSRSSVGWVERSDTHRALMDSRQGPSRNKRTLWRTERDHLLSSPRETMIQKGVGER